MSFLPGCMWHVTKETKHTADALVWNVSAKSWLKHRTSILQEILTFAKVWFNRKNESFLPLKRKICGEGKKKGKIIAWKNQTIPVFFYFSPNAEQKNSCLCLLSIPPAMSWADSSPGELCLRQSSCGFGLPMAELSQLGLGETVLTAASPRADREPTVLQLTCFCHLISDFSISFSGLGPKFVGKKIPYWTFLTCYMSRSHSYGCYLKKLQYYLPEGRK